jgi:hypothetical protein
MTGMPRVENWERRLVEAVDIARAKPFAWGDHDCASFAFETRTILTGGEDVAALWRGRYTTALGAQRVMRRLGWASIEAMGRSLLGEPRETPLLAQRGDIVLAETGLGFGVVIGATAAGISSDGLSFAALTSCQLAWAV